MVKTVQNDESNLSADLFFAVDLKCLYRIHLCCTVYNPHVNKMVCFLSKVGPTGHQNQVVSMVLAATIFIAM